MHKRLVHGIVFTIGVLGLGPVSPVRAETCDQLFPDITCDERAARPANSVMPMSFPYIFEDPYIVTGLNLVGIWHQFPNNSLPGGGDLGVLALQARLALTDRLAFIATKDGVGFYRPDRDNVLRDDNGFFNITAGLKYALWQWSDGDESAIFTPSLRYEIPSGSREIYQGSGTGILIPALSSAYQHGNWHVIAGVGGHAPLDHDKNGSNFFYNLHVDHAFPTGNENVRYIVPFIELSGIRYTGDGDGSQKAKTRALNTVTVKAATGVLGLAPFEGVDVANLGSDRVRGNDLVTMAWGFRLPIGNSLCLGLSYERPLSNAKDLFDQRVTAMLTWEL